MSLRSVCSADSGSDSADPLRVLVVDDEPIIRDLLRAMLENLGVIADVAENGIEAQRRVVAGRYQLVITDINMPEMDGIALIGWLKEYKPEVEIVVMTGYEMTDATLQTIHNTATTFFPKPPEKVKVRDTIRLCREKIRRHS